MRSTNKNRISEALTIIFFAIFAMPFFGGYLMLDKEVEMKIIGGVLCMVGIVVWCLFGLN